MALQIGIVARKLTTYFMLIFLCANGVNADWYEDLLGSKNLLEDNVKDFGVKSREDFPEMRMPDELQDLMKSYEKLFEQTRNMEELLGNGNEGFPSFNEDEDEDDEIDWKSLFKSTDNLDNLVTSLSNRIAHNLGDRSLIREDCPSIVFNIADMSIDHVAPNDINVYTQASLTIDGEECPLISDLYHNCSCNVETTTTSPPTTCVTAPADLSDLMNQLNKNLSFVHQNIFNVSAQIADCFKNATHLEDLENLTWELQKLVDQLHKVIEKIKALQAEASQTNKLRMIISSNSLARLARNMKRSNIDCTFVRTNPNRNNKKRNQRDDNSDRDSEEDDVNDDDDLTITTSLRRLASWIDKVTMDPTNIYATKALFCSSQKTLEHFKGIGEGRDLLDENEIDEAEKILEEINQNTLHQSVIEHEIANEDLAKNLQEELSQLNNQKIYLENEIGRTDDALRKHS